MNPLMVEYLIEERSKDIHREITQIQRAKLAPKGKVFRPNWFTNVMQIFGQWLISRGEDLVKRYEIPAKQCQPSERGYAR
jgi:hypothetical protein